jgi:hypothetical protein
MTEEPAEVLRVCVRQADATMITPDSAPAICEWCKTSIWYDTAQPCPYPGASVVMVCVPCIISHPEFSPEATEALSLVNKELTDWLNPGGELN